ncbi:hypothetical protein LCI18_007757 [Fusarium solani-melongenae]|uniref:Uncharacterized protein n=1 Tax=Fusarium solani subsp. cucurbitae TaxID=2747967 RepID=A0ACD3Z6P9_FUSSC|nr:hypothetical protein LCI18_007757 [Fusarium solani-melongenae]
MQTPRHHTITKSLGSGGDKGRSRCRLHQVPPLPPSQKRQKQTRSCRFGEGGEQGLSHCRARIAMCACWFLAELSHIRQRLQKSRHVRIDICDCHKPIASHRVCHHICQGIITMPRTPKPLP